MTTFEALRYSTIQLVEVGFRHRDCAERYRNEGAVGEALRETFVSGRLQREDTLITTKLSSGAVRPAFGGSRRRLQIDYVDC